MVDKPEAEAAATSNDLREVVSSILGRAPSEYEVDEGIWYDALRATLRQARADDETSQGQIAERLKVAQSEVSRLETSVGPGTSLGRVRDYLRACGARIDVTITTRAGRSLAVGARNPRVLPNLGPLDFDLEEIESPLAAEAPETPEAPRPELHGYDLDLLGTSRSARSRVLSEKEERLVRDLKLLGRGRTARQPDLSGELAALTSSLLALEETMRKENFPPDLAARLRDGVLTLVNRQAREGASETAARPPARRRATAATEARLGPRLSVGRPVAEEAE